MKKIFFSFLFVLLFLAACTSGIRRGVVAMKISEQEAHICMGAGEVEKGDKVILYKNKCGNRGRCEKVNIGEGVITEVLNDHYSVMKVTSGAGFEEGTVVEKPK